jgi:pimeloyl-ACP methyl ester carboxylesterase
LNSLWAETGTRSERTVDRFPPILYSGNKFFWKTEGYRNIWLIGVSIGGMGSLLYLREYPEDISGVYVISPFLGYPPIASEIGAAGGLSKWEPGKYNEEKDWQRMLWQWLKTYSALKHRLMADILPAEHVYRIKGAHTYKTFKALWNVFLDDSVLE